ncbi:MAG: glycosyltransferase family 2 protein [Caulobacteraceae bacterium]
MTVPVYVAIPVYNGGRTIRKTLTNVLEQTYTDFRVLVYDDGSTDRTAQLLSQFVARDDRITLLTGDQNLGRGAARNRLLEAAQDGIIAWQDADDTWNPTKLADQLSFFESFADLGIDPAKAVMISTLNRKVTRKGQPFVTKCVPPVEFDTAYVLSDDYGKCPFQLQATFGLASVYLDAGGFDENLNWSEDLDIALKILANGSRIISHATDRALATYNHSLASAKGDAVEKAQRVLRDRHRDYALANGVDIDDMFDKRRLNYLFNIYLSNKNYAKALAVTLGSLVEVDDHRIQVVSRNIIAVFRGILQAQEEIWLAQEQEYAQQGAGEPAAGGHGHAHAHAQDDMGEEDDAE